jgi:DNA polymerase V
MSENKRQLEPSLIAYPLEAAKRLTMTLYEASLSAGFPSPAEDYVEPRFDLLEHIIDHPDFTYCWRVSGDSMIDACIPDGSYIIEDRFVRPENGDIVVAVVNNEITIKQLIIESGGKVWLLPRNKAYKPIEIKEGMDFEIRGKVTGVYVNLRDARHRW